MKRLVAVAGLAILTLSLGYLVTVVQSGVSDLPEIQWTTSAVASAGAGVLLYIAAVFVWSTGWAALLTAAGQPVNIFAAFTIIGISQITKYLPGNIAHHIGRAALAKHFGLGAAGVVLSMALEVFWMMAAAVACALLALALTEAAGAASLLPLGNLALATLFIAAVAVPLAGFAAARRWGARLLGRQDGRRSTHAPDAARSGLNFLSHFVTFLLQGAILILLARGVFGIPFPDYWLGVGAFALAFVAGFLAPGVPAGIGVREAILVAGLSLEMSTGAALALATAHRITNVVGDGAIFGLALAARRYLRRPSVPAP